jgi:hypothetical protein
MAKGKKPKNSGNNSIEAWGKDDEAVPLLSVTQTRRKRQRGVL